jgi:hypothetical protein
MARMSHESGLTVEVAQDTVTVPAPAKRTRRRRRQPTVVITRRQADRFVGTRIPEVLEHQGLRRPWFAAQMGYDESAVSLVLNGRRRITPEFARRAVAVLRLPASILFVEGDREGDAPPRVAI